MTTRKYDFITGIETSAAPTATDPVNPSDPVTLSYAQSHFVQGLTSQATITAIKALATASRTNGDIVFARDQDVAFRYDSASSATADDFFYLLPASGTGRWVRVTEFDHATGNLTVPGSLTVTGNMTVDGTTTTINTATLNIEDPNITVNLGGTVATANAAVSGITVDTDVTDARIGYDSSLTSKFKAGDVGSESEVIVAAGAQTISGVKTFSGNPVFSNTPSFTGTPSFNPALSMTEQGSTPATPAAGIRSIYTTANGVAHVNSSGSVSTLVNDQGAQTIPGDKTFSGTPVFSGNPSFTGTPSFSPAINMAEQGSAPTTPAASRRLVYTASTGLRHMDSSGTVFTTVNDVGAQTISGVKTFSASPIIAPTATFTEQGSTPATPSAGQRGFYSTATGFKQIDSSGIVSDIGGSGGSGSGEVNVIASPNLVAGWVASGAGVTVATTSTASELPLEGIVTTGIKMTPVSGTDYVRYRFTMPEGLFNTKLKISWYQEALSGYASGDFKVEMHTNTASNYAGTDATLPLSTDSAGVSSIPNMKGLYRTSFDSNSSLYYELRIIRTAGTTALVMQNVIVGPGTISQGAIVGEYIAYTPTFTGFGTVTGTSIAYRRVGSNIHIIGRFTPGTSTAVEAQMTLPTGLTAASTTTNVVVGKYTRRIGTASNIKQGTVLVANAANYIGFGQDDWNTAAAPETFRNGSSIVASGEVMSFMGEVIFPIAEWQGNGTANLGQNDIEYAASTSGTWDANSTAVQSVYGPAGATISGALTANRTKIVRFTTPILPTDRVDVEILRTTGEWIPAATIHPYNQQLTVAYGVYLTGASGNDTDVTVEFGRYKWVGTGVYGSAGTDWASGEGWRVVKTKMGVATGFGFVSETASGLMPFNMANLDNATATRLGHKTYAHGTNYNGGNAPTVTLFAGGGSLTSVQAANFIPYQMQDLSWRMKFNFAVTLSATPRTSVTIAVNGITSKNIASYNQAVVSYNVNGGVVAESSIDPNTNKFVSNYASTNTSRHYFSGDIDLDSKPTWAY